MTNEEMSNMLDTLLTSYGTKALFGEQSSKAEITLDEYEKSVFLTQAQDIIVKTYFETKTNDYNEGFDDSERRQVDFSSLIKIYKPSLTTSINTTDYSTNITKDQNDDTKLCSMAFDSRGLIYKLPSNILFMINESFIVNNKRYVVKPISYKEYDRQMSKAYAQPLKKQCWRVFQNQGTGYDIYSEIIPIQYVKDLIDKSNAVSEYIIRYIKRPTPIIIVDLPDGLSIDGESKQSECKLNPILHFDIVNEAFKIAITSRGRSFQDEQQQRQKNN